MVVHAYSIAYITSPMNTVRYYKRFRRPSLFLASALRVLFSPWSAPFIYVRFFHRLTGPTFSLAQRGRENILVEILIRVFIYAAVEVLCTAEFLLCSLLLQNYSSGRYHRHLV